MSIPIVYRDFHVSHPDFEDFLGDDRGILASMLGADGKPVYASMRSCVTIVDRRNLRGTFSRGVFIVERRRRRRVTRALPTLCSPRTHVSLTALRAQSAIARTEVAAALA